MMNYKLDPKIVTKTLHSHLDQIEKACIGHEHEYSFIYTNTKKSPDRHLTSLVQNTCIAGLLGSILENILCSQSIHHPENKLFKDKILRIQKHCNNYLAVNVRKGLEWNYHPINTKTRLPNDLDDTSLALYSLSSLTNNTDIRNHCYKLINDTSCGTPKINTWLTNSRNPIWFHEDITVLAHFGRLCNLYKITHEPLISQIHRHIIEDHKSIFYVNNWWALYALCDWFHDTQCLNKLYDSCTAKETITRVPALRLLCHLKLKQRGVKTQIDIEQAHNTYHNIITLQNNSDDIGIYYEKINCSQVSIAHSPLVKLAIEVEILLHDIHKEQ